jgi:hypothetical protein
MGTVSDSQGGGDTLDFWAHDSDYLEPHAGNHGDATDPFDGGRFRRFSSVTNPAAVSSDDVNDVTIEQISGNADRMSFVVRNNPPDVELSDVTPLGPRVTAGTPMAIIFHLTNVGGTPANGLRAALMTDDEIVEILHPDLELFPLAAGRRTLGPVGPDGFPQIRFPSDLEEEHTVSLRLVIFAETTEILRASFSVTGVPAHQLVMSVSTEESVPLAGVRVSLFNDTAADEVFFDKFASTDSLGIAEFHVPAGSDGIQAAADAQSSWGSERIFAIGVFSAETHVVLRAADNVQSVFARSDDQGAYSTRVAAGSYQVTSQPVGGRAAPQNHGDIEIDGDTTLDIQLKPGLNLTVHVVDEEGNPVVGAQVSARPATESISTVWAFTARDRGARLEVQPGDIVVTVVDVPAPFVQPREETAVTVVSDTSLTVTIPRGAYVTARLVDESGQEFQIPSSRFFVQIEFNGELGHASESFQPGTSAVALGLPPGSHSARVDVYSSAGTDLGFPSQGLGTVEISGDTTLTFTVQSGVALTGRLIGFSGGSNSTVFFNSPQSSTSASVASEGTFVVRLVPDEYSVNVSYCCDDFPPPSQSLRPIEIQGDDCLAVIGQRRRRGSRHRHRWRTSLRVVAACQCQQ